MKRNFIIAALIILFVVPPYYILLMKHWVIVPEEKDRFKVVVGMEMVAMPEYYRRITGYDSIQLIRRNAYNNLETNFCHPNQWEFEKFKH